MQNSNEPAFQAPRNKLEETITQIWLKILKVESVSVHDNYYALGGDSLLVIRIFNELREFNWGLELSDLYRCQTIAELAQLVAERSNKIAA